MGWVAPVANLVGTGTQVYGQFKSGQNAADVYEYNQQIAKYQSKYAQDRGRLEEAALERDVSKHIARKRAIQGKSGTTGGSNIDTLLEMRNEADMDAAIIRYNADVESYAADNQADLLGTQADQFDASSYLNVGATLLGSASRYDPKKIKAPAKKWTPVAAPAGSSGIRYGFK